MHQEARNAVVILNLRGRDDISSTFNGVLQRYAATLSKNDCLLMLSGINPLAHDQLNRAKAIQTIGAENVFLAALQLGQAKNQSLRAARSWLKENT